ncbi:MAG: hypothetical protein ACI4D4_08430 [Lachnospira sp.]
MSELDFRKQLLLNEFKTMSKGKDASEILPLILAISNKANQAGIVFTKSDCELIFEDLKPSMTPEQQQILPGLLMMLGNNS